MGRITVFTRDSCAHCKKCKDLFVYGYGAEVKEINLDDYPEKSADLLKLNNNGPVPQVYFNDNLIGGAIDVQHISDRGDLQELLDALAKTPETINPLLCKPDYEPRKHDDWKSQELTIQDETISYAKLVERLEAELPHEDNKHHMKVHKSCFRGYDLVTYLMQAYSIKKREEAVQLATYLYGAKVVKEVHGKNKFEDTHAFYTMRHHSDAYLQEHKEPGDRELIVGESLTGMAMVMMESDKKYKKKYLVLSENLPGKLGVFKSEGQARIEEDNPAYFLDLTNEVAYVILNAVNGQTHKDIAHLVLHTVKEKELIKTHMQFPDEAKLEQWTDTLQTHGLKDCLSILKQGTIRMSSHATGKGHKEYYALLYRDRLTLMKNLQKSSAIAREFLFADHINFVTTERLEMNKWWHFVLRGLEDETFFQDPEMKDDTLENSWKNLLSRTINSPGAARQAYPGSLKEGFITHTTFARRKWGKHYFVLLKDKLLWFKHRAHYMTEFTEKVGEVELTRFSECCTYSDSETLDNTFLLSRTGDADEEQLLLSLGEHEELKAKRLKDEWLKAIRGVISIMNKENQAEAIAAGIIKEDFMYACFNPASHTSLKWTKLYFKLTHFSLSCYHKCESTGTPDHTYTMDKPYMVEEGTTAVNFKEKSRDSTFANIKSFIKGNEVGYTSGNSKRSKGFSGKNVFTITLNDNAVLVLSTSSVRQKRVWMNMITALSLQLEYPLRRHTRTQCAIKSGHVLCKPSLNVDDDFKENFLVLTIANIQLYDKHTDYFKGGLPNETWPISGVRAEYPLRRHTRSLHEGPRDDPDGCYDSFDLYTGGGGLNGILHVTTKPGLTRATEVYSWVQSIQYMVRVKDEDTSPIDIDGDREWPEHIKYYQSFCDTIQSACNQSTYWHIPSALVVCIEFLKEKEVNTFTSEGYGSHKLVRALLFLVDHQIKFDLYEMHEIYIKHNDRRSQQDHILLDDVFNDSVLATLKFYLHRLPAPLVSEVICDDMADVLDMTFQQLQQRPQHGGVKDKHVDEIAREEKKMEEEARHSQKSKAILVKKHEKGRFTQGLPLMDSTMTAASGELFGLEYTYNLAPSLLQAQRSQLNLVRSVAKPMLIEASEKIIDRMTLQEYMSIAYVLQFIRSQYDKFKDTAHSIEISQHYLSYVLGWFEDSCKTFGIWTRSSILLLMISRVSELFPTEVTPVLKRGRDHVFQIRDVLLSNSGADDYGIFDCIMQSTLGKFIFLAYGKLKYVDENIRFIYALEDFNEEDEAKCAVYALALYKDFVKPESKYEINIQGKNSKALAAIFEDKEPEDLIGRGRDTFKDAELEVRKLIISNSVQSFLKSPHGHQWLTYSQSCRTNDEQEPEAPPTATATASSSRKSWLKTETGGGRFYFIDASSRETQWDAPAEGDVIYQRLVSPQGQPYIANLATNETSWAVPEVLKVLIPDINT